MHKKLPIRRTLLLLLFLFNLPAFSLGHKLTGTIIGTQRGYNYSTGVGSSTTNIRDCAFDGDLTTFFAASTSSGGWVGLDLGKAYVINKVGFAASPRSNGAEQSQLGLFEGANQPDSPMPYLYTCSRRLRPLVR